MIEENELWLPIKGYENLYEISSFGRIKGMPKYKGKGGNIFVPERIMKLGLNKCGKGYYQVTLVKKGVSKTTRIHRIVALNFIENPFNLAEVNHKDGDTKNNKVSNLEWCTRLQNNQHAIDMGLIKRTGKDNSSSRPVIQMDMYGAEIARFESCLLAEKSFGFHRSHINRLCNGNGKYKSCYGFKWKYA